MSEKSDILTFGCRLNIYESEVISKHLTDSGIENTTVINTCSVTKEAERKVQQSIRKLKKSHPNRRIVVTGCASQVNPEKYAAMKEVSSIIGNEEKMKLSSYFKLKEKDEIIISDIMAVKDTALHMIDGFQHHARAFLQIQNGCNHRCTFCQIPFARGNSRSVPLGDIVAQSHKLIENGCNEIVVTGVDLTDYGLDLPGAPRLGSTLRRMLNLLPDLKRLRISSIDVAEIDDDFFDLLVNESRIMPHIHLSLQSGDNMILKRMKRRHNREQVIDFCDKISALRPDITFGSDIICGFPTENDQMFQNTYDLVERCNIIHNHVFPYSSRDDTPAARMPQVDISLRKLRANKLRSLSRELLLKHYRKQIGEIKNVLIEDGMQGRSEDYSMVMMNDAIASSNNSINNDMHKIGSVIRVKIHSVDEDEEKPSLRAFVVQ